jgi:hypothetical protein
VDSARAEVIVTASQVGADVVFSASGTADVTDLGTPTLSLSSPGLNTAEARIYLGTGTNVADEYFSGISGPASFGPYAQPLAISGSGDFLGIAGAFGELILPAGYVSGSELSSSVTFAGDFASLNLTPGTYTYTWGSGADADSFVVQIGPVAMPEPSTLSLMILPAVAACCLSRTRRTQRG